MAKTIDFKVVGNQMFMEKLFENINFDSDEMRECICKRMEEIILKINRPEIRFRKAVSIPASVEESVVEQIEEAFESLYRKDKEDIFYLLSKIVRLTKDVCKLEQELSNMR